VSGGLPVATATRETDRRDAQVWVVKRCCFCHRRHTHAADPVQTSVILPAHCNPTRFFRLREVSP
jgi:hypothetical protein